MIRTQPLFLFTSASHRPSITSIASVVQNCRVVCCEICQSSVLSLFYPRCKYDYLIRIAPSFMRVFLLLNALFDCSLVWYRFHQMMNEVSECCDGWSVGETVHTRSSLLFLVADLKLKHLSYSIALV